MCVSVVRHRIPIRCAAALLDSMKKLYAVAVAVVK